MSDKLLARIAPPMFWVMVIGLSAGLMGCVALGFGAPVPASAVIACIVVGTIAMIALITILIRQQMLDKTDDADTHANTNTKGITR